MKLISSFVIILLASLAYAFPNDMELGFETSDIESFDLPVSEDQIQCIRDAGEKLIAENPDLEAWFEDIKITADKFKDEAIKCETHSGLRKRACYAKIKVLAIKEYRRILKALPADRKEIIDEITVLVKGCLNME